MPRFWQQRGLPALLLWPLSLVYAQLMRLRRFLYRKQLLASQASALPVVVVGNVSVGGTGKTPLTAWLAEELAAAGWRPGIVSRGYGGSLTKESRQATHRVHAGDDPRLVGDEPLLLSRLTGVPVVIAAQRALAVAALARSGDVDVVLSDDGLQHLAMQRDIDIVVVDGQRGLGNGFCLPAGPLRESASRVREAALLVIQHDADGDLPVHDSLQDLLHADKWLKTGCFTLQLQQPEAIDQGPPAAQGEADTGPASASPSVPTPGDTVRALAAIGNPERFFSALEARGYSVVRTPLPDHHAYSADDLQFDDDLPILLTSKDAVKVAALSLPQHISRRIHEVPVQLVADTDLLALRDGVLLQLAISREATRG